MDIEIGKLKSKIITDNPDLLNALCDIYALKIKGAEYSQAYRRRRWDGKKHFISTAGYFKNGLLEDILETLSKVECTPTLIYKDKKQDKSTSKLLKLKDFTYYDYQEELIRMGLKEKTLVIESATASGKTIIMAGIIKSLGKKKMVVLFHEKHILKQTYDFFVNEAKLSNIGLNYGEGFIYGDIMLSTVQSIDKILDTHLEEAEVLMVDEVHEFANGETRLAAIESFPAATYRIGLTATVPKEKILRFNLIGSIGPVRKVLSTKDLVEKGVLAKPLIQLIPINYDDHPYDDSVGYPALYDKYITNNKFRNNIIASIVKKAQENKDSRVAIVVQSLNHGKILAKLIPGSLYIQGLDDIPSRYKAINNFRSGKVTCLIGTKILQTGVNIKEITHWINARGLQRYTSTLQAIGRSLRSGDNKTSVFIYDFMDGIRHLDKHSKARRSHYKKEGHEIETLEELKYEE